MVPDGPWENWGYLYYSEARPEQNLIWKVWLRNKEPDVRGIDAKVKATIYRGGQPICTNPDATHNLKPMWNRWEFFHERTPQGNLRRAGISRPRTCWPRTATTSSR